MPSISANLNIMIKASEKASKGLIRDFGELEQLQVSIKGPSDFVTNADIKAEKIIIDELTKSRKNYSILSEESGSKENKDIDNVWIYDPIKDEMFYAEKNNGAYFNNKRIRVSKRKKIEECLFASGEIDNENIKQKTNAKLKTRKSGSAALDMAYVASGRYDGYFQKNLNLWDIAAGIIIVKEAGGQVNDLNLKQNNNIDIIASSSSINEKLLKNLINF